MARCFVNPAVQAFVAITLLFFMHPSFATQYNVGGSAGWGVTGTNYGDWASKNDYHVGDKLYFSYTAGLHSVLQVSESDYRSCSTTNPISSDKGVGNKAVELKAPGEYYYICGTPGHCAEGMKFSITVTTNSSSSTTPSTPSSTSPNATSAVTVSSFSAPVMDTKYVMILAAAGALAAYIDMAAV
eukprot:c8246_g1_i1 orf=257-811(-)